MKRVYLGQNHKFISAEPLTSFNLIKGNKITKITKNGDIFCIKCMRKATHVCTFRHAGGIHRGYYIKLTDYKYLAITKDHILPRSLGGTDQLSNLQPMCHDCNREKENIVDNTEILQIMENLRDHTSAARMRTTLVSKTRHPLSGWLGILQRFPELSSQVEFR